MNVVDIIILIVLAFGALAGFKAGVIKKTADFVGMLAVIILSFYLKNYLSVIMYENLPFLNFGGFIKGIEAINILFYEILAFLIVFSLLLILFRIILMVTGFIEKILKATIILSIPSKLLGIIVGTIEMYMYVFIILVVLTLPIIKVPYIRESKISNFMLNNTPILSNVSDEMVSTYNDIYKIVDERDNKTNEQLNDEVIKLLLDKKVITRKSLDKLIEKDKIHVSDNLVLN